LVLERLRGEGPEGAATSQAYFDAYLSGLDHGLRELAVGDLSVAKTMRRLGEAFYGRGQALQAALEALPERDALHALIRRTVFGGCEDAEPTLLADYLIVARAALAAQPGARLLAGEIDWPALG
jgi:cytochrome b pre-mRNA-processing protein 3